MRVGIVVGICVPHDAISSAVCAQVEIILRLPGVTAVDLFTTHVDRATNCETHRVADAWELHRHPAFGACDVVIFHWGIITPLFDVLWLMDLQRQRVAVHFHNVTSPEVVDPSQREVAERSLRQLELVNTLPVELWTFSEFNEQTLRDLGVDAERIRFVPFPVRAPRQLRRAERGATTRLLCVGRMVPAKGTHTLIEAIGRVVQQGGSVELVIAGNAGLSHSPYIDELHRRVGDLGLTDVVRFEAPDDEALWELFEWADIVVSPSLHEGLCVPIIEGYLAGCHAIGTTAGNLPYVVQQPDPVVPVGDAAALADAIVAVAERLDASSPRWRRNIDWLCDQFSTASTASALATALHLDHEDLPDMSSSFTPARPGAVRLQPWIEALPDSVMRTRDRSTLNRLPDLVDWEPGNRFTDLLRELRQPVTIHRKSWEYGLCLQGLEQLGCLVPEAAAIAVGAGTEPPLYYLANRIRRMVATDLYDNPQHEGNPAMLADPAAFAPFEYRRDHLEVHRMSGDQLDFADGEFDISFSLSSIEHFGSRVTQRAAFDEMIRVVRPGGVICIMTELILTEHRHDEYFQWEEMRELFLSHPSVELVGGDIDLSISESLVEHPVDMSNPTFVNRSPHIVLRLDGMEWTSLSLFFRRR